MKLTEQQYEAIVRRQMKPGAALPAAKKRQCFTWNIEKQHGSVASESIRESSKDHS